MYRALVLTLAAQLGALPETAFDAELPEMDVWFMDEISELRGIVKSLGVGLDQDWKSLCAVVKERFGWNVEQLQAVNADDGDEDEDEEGEYAPVVVET